MENPKLIDVPFADNDPDTQKNFPIESAGDEIVTQSDGWKPAYSTALESGGRAPKRADMNGMFNWVTRLLQFCQRGWVWKYDANQPYYTPCIVWDGNLYFCKKDVQPGETYHRPSTDINPFNTWEPLSRYLGRQLHKVSLTGDYNDLENKPVIGNGKISITLNGKEFSFTLNQTGNASTEFAIPVASETASGTIKVGENLAIKDGVLSVKSSPDFKGVPTAPTAPNGTSTKQIATTEFVKNVLRYQLLGRYQVLNDGKNIPSGTYGTVNGNGFLIVYNARKHTAGQVYVDGVNVWTQSNEYNNTNGTTIPLYDGCEWRVINYGTMYLWFCPIEGATITIKGTK